MKTFEIRSILVDGYERICKLKDSLSENEYLVKFIEYDEYLETNQKSNKRKVGDFLTGNLKISLVSNAYKEDQDIYFNQPNINSNYVEAIVEIKTILDDFTINAYVEIIDEIIEVEFENKINFKSGTKVKLSGSLELSDY